MPIPNADSLALIAACWQEVRSTARCSANSLHQGCILQALLHELRDLTALDLGGIVSNRSRWLIHLGRMVAQAIRLPCG